jgi:hypothetical protein
VSGIRLNFLDEVLLDTQYAANHSTLIATPFHFSFSIPSLIALLISEARLFIVCINQAIPSEVQATRRTCCRKLSIGEWTFPGEKQGVEDTLRSPFDPRKCCPCLGRHWHQAKR